jgi:RNA:NAD 2'-phosphotransferase (TPT1/KptA family)
VKKDAKEAIKRAKIARREKERWKTTRAIALNLRHAATQRNFRDTRSTD